LIVAATTSSGIPAQSPYIIRVERPTTQTNVSVADFDTRTNSVTFYDAAGNIISYSYLESEDAFWTLSAEYGFSRAVVMETVSSAGAENEVADTIAIALGEATVSWECGTNISLPADQQLQAEVFAMVELGVLPPALIAFLETNGYEPVVLVSLTESVQESATGNTAVHDTITITEDASASQSRRPSALIFAEYEQWGLSIEGLYSNSDGGFIATPTQNVFFQGQLIRGFSDFGHGVDMSIASVNQSEGIWIHVIRDADGNIERLDTE